MSAKSQDAQIQALCAQLAQDLLRRHWKLVTAESCTGGMIAAACTSLSGSSAWFDRAMVSYSNEAKSAMLGVAPALITQHGAVSEAVARAMAEGAVVHSLAQVSIAVTGVAGPTGGSATKPVGTVWFGWSVAGQVSSEVCRFAGDRSAVRAATVRHALARLLALLGAAGSGASPLGAARRCS